MRRRLVGLAVDLALAGLAARLWTLLLLKQHTDAPLTVAAWLGGAAAFVAAGRAAARRWPAPGVALPWFRRLTGAQLLCLGLLLVLLFLFHFSYTRVRSDGRDHFVVTRSLVLDRDFDIAAELERFGARGTAPIYPMGTAVLWSPFYAAGHASLGLLNLAGGAHDRSGYGNPYQMAVGLATVFYGFLGLVLLYRIVRLWYPARLSFWTTLALCTGTFVLWYLTIDASMTHGVSLFASALFLYYWLHTRARLTPGTTADLGSEAGQARSIREWAVLGALAGLMALVRWGDGLLAVVVAIDAGRDYWRAARRRREISLRMVVAGHAAFAAAALAVFVPQLVFWEAVRGSPAALPLERYGLSWTSPAIESVLFSPHHGLLTATPLVCLALVGMLPFLRRAPAIGVMLLAAFLTQVYVNSVPGVWWGGSAFGARRFASSMPILAVGLAALFDGLLRRPALTVAFGAAAFVGTNVIVMEEVRTGRINPGDGVSLETMFRAVYARVGNPFSLPLSAVFAWRYGVSPAKYDRIAERFYNELAIDLGEEGDEIFLTTGWAERERDRTSFRWATATESGVLVPLARQADYELTFRAEAFRFPGAPAGFVFLRLNGRPLSHVPLQRGWGEYRLHVPADRVQRGVNEIRFYYAYARSPKSVGLSDDPRSLAVRFDYIRLTPAS